MSNQFVTLTRTNGESVQVSGPNVSAIVDAGDYRRVYTTNQTRNADPWLVTETLAAICTAIQTAMKVPDLVSTSPFATCTLTSTLNAAFQGTNVADIRADPSDATLCFAYILGQELPFHVAATAAAFRADLNTANPYTGLGGANSLAAIIEINGSNGTVVATDSLPGFTVSAALTAPYTPGSGVYDYTLTGLGGTGLRAQAQVKTAAGVRIATRCEAAANAVGVTYKDAAGAAAEPTRFFIYLYRTIFA
jgi:hypothetical protein